jgi:site-specific recombinase XerD
MGHRDIKTTQIYADYQPDDQLEPTWSSAPSPRGPF